MKRPDVRKNSERNLRIMAPQIRGKNVLVKVSGPDHPGITSALMSIVARSGDQILDIGQSVTHGLLSLSFVIAVDKQKKDDSGAHVLKDLLFEATSMGLHLDYQVVDDLSATNDVTGEKFILNCVAPEAITANFLGDLATTLAKYRINILRIDKVSPKDFSGLEISTNVPTSVDWNLVKADLISVSNLHKIDVAFLKDNVFRRSKRLVVFDMDSTLIQTEVIDEMADVHGVGPEVRAITERAMNGEMDFNESLKLRVSQLKGLTKEQLEEILVKLPLTKGVEDFIKTIKGLGYKVALISGGFSFFANALKEKLHLDYAFANELEFHEGKLTGNVMGTIINAEQKALLLKLIAQQENISLEQVVAIGDGANDLPMLSAAGLGIAFHAKEMVKARAGNHLSHGPMTSVLYFLGIPGHL